MRILQRIETLGGMAVLAVALTGTLSAQADQAQPQRTEPQRQGDTRSDQSRDRMAGNTLTGCLNKGEGGTYELTDEGTGVKTAVSGSSDLEKHSANHKVKLTGAIKTDGSGKATFEVTKLEHVSASCTAAK